MPAVVLIGIVAAGALAAPAPAPAAAAAWLGGADDPERDLDARDDGQRLRAVLELARLDEARATMLLVPRLTDRNPNVRLAAARLLARRGAKEATAAAVAWLATRTPQEQFLGLLVLRQVSALTSEARHATERALRDGDLQSRLQALDVLTAHPAPSSFGAVAGALDDELAEVRLRAVRALEATRDPRASVPLLAHVADADRGVREATLDALGVLGDKRVLPALLRQVAVDPRGDAVDALARLGDAGPVPALIGLSRRRPRDETAGRAAFALGVLATPEGVDTLLALAREPPGADDVRRALERAGAAAVPRLCRELEIGTPTSARLAAEALGCIGDRRATAALAAAATRGRTGPTLAALEALARLADPAAVPALARLAERGEPADLRALALDALTAIGDDRAVEVLPRALGDGDAGVRARAVRLAARLGAVAPADAVAQRLADPDPDVRLQAALALGRLPARREVAPPILAALAPGTPPLTEAAASSLGDALERLALDGDALAPAYLASVEPRARGVLARALAASPRPATREVATALIRDLSGDGALPAADALARATLTRDQQKALAVAFARASEDVAARLAPAMARFPAGAAALDALVADDGAPPSVRAGSTWALSSARGPATWTAVRLTDATGAPWAAHWVSVTNQTGAGARAL
ncbi:MAG TPA: HEAT repeat domain-containing protein, partial [Polyangia bacterium]|nr:HEAT repeat domain-containing protein [Polyangia bacterium]